MKQLLFHHMYMNMYFTRLPVCQSALKRAELQIPNRCQWIVYRLYVDKRLETYSTKHVENRFNPNFAKNIECRIG